MSTASLFAETMIAMGLDPTEVDGSADLVWYDELAVIAEQFYATGELADNKVNKLFNNLEIVDVNKAILYDFYDVDPEMENHFIDLTDTATLYE